MATYSRYAFAVALLASPANAQSLLPGGALQNQQQPTTNQQQRASDNRGTDQVPFVIKELPRERTAEERQETQNKSELDRELTRYTAKLATYTAWLFGATLLLALLTGGLAIAAFLQMREGRRSIKAAEDAAKAAADSAKHLESSIAQASRSADAMEGVSAAMTENVANTKVLVDRQREFAMLQVRPYISVIEPGYVPQTPAPPLFAGIQVSVLNTGHSPAHNFRFVSRVRIFPIPLPADFDFTIPETEIFNSGHINPGQKFFFRRTLDRMITDAEFTDIQQGNGVRIYIYGTLWFDDVFGEGHHTNFAQFGVWDTMGRFSTLNIERHNDAT